MEILWKYIIPWTNTRPDNGVLHCPLLVLLLTCLGELPHPGEVVHVAVAHHGVGGQEELRGDLERGVGGQGGQVDSHQLVTVKPANNKHQTYTTTRSLSSQVNKTFSSSLRFTLNLQRVDALFKPTVLLQKLFLQNFFFIGFELPKTSFARTKQIFHF